jgi:hypothetical protein
MNFPDNCIKGVPNHTYFNDDGRVRTHLFYFSLTADRDDGWTEQSINCEDDNTVVEFTLNQRRLNGELQFGGGVVVIPLEEIDRLNNRPAVKGLLSYERRPIEGNPFHGNILLRANTSKPTKTLIAAGLALAISKVISRADEP